MHPLNTLMDLRCNTALPNSAEGSARRAPRRACGGGNQGMQEVDSTPSRLVLAPL